MHIGISEVKLSSFLVVSVVQRHYYSEQVRDYLDIRHISKWDIKVWQEEGEVIRKIRHVYISKKCDQLQVI